LSEAAGKGRGSQNPPKPKKDAGGGFWSGLAEGLVGGLSRRQDGGEQPNPADPVSRMEPVNRDRKETGDEMVFRATEGNQGQAPMERASRERRYVARALAAQQAGSTQTRIPKGSGAPLQSTVRSKMEPKLGANLGDVRIHNDGESAQAAKGFGARAFTVGQDVHFNAGEFNPGTKEGDKLIAHELTHVVQGQKSGIQRKPDDEEGADPQEAGGAEVSDPNEPAEKEADAVADHVADRLDAEGPDGEEGEKKKGEAAAKEVGEKETGEKDGGDAHGANAAPAIGAKLEGVGLKVFRAQIPESTSAHTGLLNQYTRALGQYRAAQRQLRDAYGDGMKTAGAPGPQTSPNRGRVDPANAAILAGEQELDRQEAVLRAQQGTAAGVMQHAGSLLEQRAPIRARIDEIRTAAQLAEAQRNMTHVGELLGDGQRQPGFEIGDRWEDRSCQALPRARALAGMTLSQALGALGPARQRQGTTSDYVFGDGSRIRLDQPNFDGGRARADANRPHLAIYPPNNDTTHLSIDGIVVPPTAQTAHIYLNRG
jgi:hypothetical protein